MRKQRISVRISPETRQRLNEVATAEDRTVAAVAERALRDGLARVPQTTPPPTPEPKS